MDQTTLSMYFLDMGFTIPSKPSAFCMYMRGDVTYTEYKKLLQEQKRRR